MGLARALQIVARHYHSRNASRAPRTVLWPGAACTWAAAQQVPGSLVARHAGGIALRPRRGGRAAALQRMLFPRMPPRRPAVRAAEAVFAAVCGARLREQQARARGLHVHGGPGRRGRAGTGMQSRAGGAPSTSGAPGPATASRCPFCPQQPARTQTARSAEAPCCPPCLEARLRLKSAHASCEPRQLFHVLRQPSAPAAVRGIPLVRHTQTL
jgi:hypothetical protein